MASVNKWVEKVKEVSLKENGPAWVPTSNERNANMIKEARTYSWALVALHRDLTSWDHAVKITLNSVSNLLKAALPRVFDEAASGAAFPATREHRVVASDVPTEVLAGASQVLREKLARDVLKPLQQWLEAYKKIRDDNQQVEELRTELDMRRRSHGNVQYKVDKLTAVVTSPREAALQPAESAKFEAAEGKLVSKTVQLEKEEDKTARLAQRYVDAEAQVFNSIFALIQDVHVLRDYAAAAITLMQETFTSSLRAFQDGPAAAQEDWVAHPEPAALGAYAGRPLVAQSPFTDRASSNNSSRRTTVEDGQTDGRARLAFTSGPASAGAKANLISPGTPTTPVARRTTLVE